MEFDDIIRTVSFFAKIDLLRLRSLTKENLMLVKENVMHKKISCLKK